jgi:hypothetical protein
MNWERYGAKGKMKISLGETKHIRNELEAFAGPGKPRGCPICQNGDDVKVAQVARDAGYTAAQVAAFFIKTRDYSESLMNREVIYRHWYRCEAKMKRQEEREG